MTIALAKINTPWGMREGVIARLGEYTRVVKVGRPLPRIKSLTNAYFCQMWDGRKWRHIFRFDEFQPALDWFNRHKFPKVKSPIEIVVKVTGEDLWTSNLFASLIRDALGQAGHAVLMLAGKGMPSLPVMSRQMKLAPRKIKIVSKPPRGAAE